MTTFPFHRTHRYRIYTGLSVVAACLIAIAAVAQDESDLEPLVEVRKWGRHSSCIFGDG